MPEQISTREAILGAATALEGQWAPSWVDALRRAAGPGETPEAGIDRVEFVRRFPGMDEGLEQFETLHGKFVRSGSVNFEDGRFVMVTRFERAYSIAFHNPQNVGGEQTLETVLSPEALRALTILAGLFEMPGDMDALEAALGMPRRDERSESRT